VSILSIIFSLLIILFISSCGVSGSGNGNGNGSDNGGSVTTLVFTNTGSSSVIIGFVNAAVGGACPDANDLLTAKELSDSGWCTGFIAGVDSAGKCLVTLGAAGSDTASVTVPNPDGKCMSGGFGAGGFAQCNTAEYPQGWTQGEFTLNPKATTQEVVDISGVNGINFAVSISLGSGWYFGTNTTVTEVGPNNALNGNVGVPGVYPNGCTDCIQLVGNPVCPDLTTNPTCQASRICNIKRDNTTGGTVEFKIGERLDS